MVSDVYLSDQRRDVDPHKVTELAKSIDEIGLQNPIIVREVAKWVDDIDGEMDGAYVLVSGRHRLEAQKLRGETHIEAYISDLDELHAELAEIDENLIRSNLSPAEEASAISRRKAIYEELHPETKHGGDRKSDQFANLAKRNDRFTEATAAATGKAERNIQRAAARADALGDDLKAVQGTSLDKGVELDALAKMGVDERRKVIQSAQAGENVSARQVKIDGDIRNRAARELAEWIVEHANGNDLDAVKANLFAAGAKNVAIELTNLLGESIMDRRYGS